MPAHGNPTRRPGEASEPPALSVGEVALGTLLDDSTLLRPDDLPAAVRRKAALVGLEEATIYLIDKDQRRLLPFPRRDGHTLPVDSLPGRAFRRSEAVVSDESPDGTQVWFPLLDGRDRLGVLGARAPDPDALLLTRGRQLAALTAELLAAKSDYGDNILTARRLADMSLAAEMRWSLLPPLTFASPEIFVAGYVVPAYHIAGDAFDYAVNGDTAHVAIFDARGHGLTASRIANLAVASYRHSRRNGLPLTRTCLAIDATIDQELGEEMFATAQLATVDLPDGRFRWINAGHPPPLLLRDGRHVHELTGEPSLPVGLGSDDVAVHELGLEPGDVVAFYSDGVTEARSPHGEEFGVERLADFLVRAAAAEESPAETVRRLMHSIVDHAGDDEGNLVDDATLVLVGWRPRRW